MPVILLQSKNVNHLQDGLVWFAITGTKAVLDPTKKLENLGARLEEKFNSIRDDWWKLGHKLGQTPSARLAHMPTAASYNCDFGLMMAWTKLTKSVAASSNKCVVLCDDPWVFRQLAELPGVFADKPPSLFVPTLKAWLRGWLARSSLALGVIVAHFQLRGTRTNSKKGGASLLVYGHPDSNCEAHDAYFGSLMSDLPGINRLIHTDANTKLTKNLAKDNRTAGLHAWGTPWFAPSLIFQRWKASQNDTNDFYKWILSRAIIKENSTASLASNRWQIHCQDRWLKKEKPETVIWPWENHPWEREFCRSARKIGVRTGGYQHAVIGPQQFNPGPASNPDGLESIPDRIICSGPAYHDQLIEWGIPLERLCIGGAFRIAKFEGNFYDPDGPVFVATSSMTAITKQMMKAIKLARRPGRMFLIKDHPLYPMHITESYDIRRTPKTIPETTGISAVFYGTGTSGLEGLLAGVPTYRFISDDQIAIDVLPPHAKAYPISLSNLGEALDKKKIPQKLDWTSVYAPVDLAVWTRELNV